MTLTDFLEARIAEDEADAVRASGVAFPEPASLWAAMHVRTWTPTRVLAECEAKRRIVARHLVEEMKGQSREGERGCVACNWNDLDGFIMQGPCDTLRALALPYADHPSFQEEWRPTE